MPYWSDEFVQNMLEKEALENQAAWKMPGKKTSAIPNLAKPSTVASGPSLSSRVEKQPQLKPFPLMQLPLELRQLVYGEMLRPNERDFHDSMFDDCEPDSESKTWIIKEQEYAVAVKDSKHRANLLATSRQVNAEASAVWYMTQYIKVHFLCGMEIDGNMSGMGAVLPMPAYMPKVRNLHIHLEDTDVQRPSLTSSKTTKHFARLCHELSAHTHGLMNVVVEIPCICAMDDRRKILHSRPLTDHESNCLPADEFEQLLKPLERLRVSRSIQLKSSCRNATEYQQPIFDRIATVVKSAEPIPELEGNELVWWNLMERARPFLNDEERWLCKMLHSVHLAADIQMWMNLYPSDEHYFEKTLASATTEEEKHAAQIAQWQDSFEKEVQVLEEHLDVLESEAARSMLQKQDARFLTAKTTKAEKAAAGSSKGKKRRAGSDNIGEWPLRKQRV
ncbi:MAG: hypothetical protein Q9208_006023 [Pyrenodesmia sp. 3 TL-2023]